MVVIVGPDRHVFLGHSVIGSQALLHEGPRGTLAEPMTRLWESRKCVPAPSEMGSERSALALRQDLLRRAEIPAAAQEREVIRGV